MNKLNKWLTVFIKIKEKYKYLNCLGILAFKYNKIKTLQTFSAIIRVLFYYAYLLNYIVLYTYLTNSKCMRGHLNIHLRLTSR